MPVTIFITPGGNPASQIRSPNLNNDKGVYSAGFITIVQPAHKAGAIFHIAVSRGIFLINCLFI